MTGHQIIETIRSGGVLHMHSARGAVLSLGVTKPCVAVNWIAAMRATESASVRRLPCDDGDLYGAA